jgi:membrane protein
MKKKKGFKKLIHLFKVSYDEFKSKNGVKLSASLSYYTIFSLPPLLFIIVYVSGLIFGEEAVRGEIFGQISNLAGTDAAKQIEEMLASVKFSNGKTVAGIVGAFTLIAGASGVFGEMQDSMNLIWGLKPKPKRGWIKMLVNRAISFSMIMSLAFLLMVSLIVNAFIEVLNQRLQHLFPDAAVILFYILNLLIIFVIIALLFWAIFKALPDGKITGKHTLYGAMFTAFLFMIGKTAIGIYLGNSNVASGYGAAGSLIVVLLWVYYSANILYFGASFTKVYAHADGKKIIPNKYAVYIEQKETEKEPRLKYNNGEVEREAAE